MHTCVRRVPRHSPRVNRGLILSSNNLCTIADNSELLIRVYRSSGLKNTWTYSVEYQVHFATVDGRQFRNVTEIENVSVFSMTYDWIGGHIFITEDRGFQIELLTINGEEVGSFLLHDVQQTRNLPRPGDVIFDMNESTLYWTTLSRSGLGRSIQYMSLNSPNVVRTLNVSGKTSDLMIDKLTFEPSTRSLYWINRSNTTNSTIERFDILSGNLTIIATDATSVSVLAAMTVSDRPYVFWYNMRDRAIYRYDGQHRNYSLYQYWTAPGPIVGFVGSERQPRITVPHPCLSSPRPCSHLCIQQQRTPGYHCGCPSNRNLEPDDTTCSELQCEGVQSPCNDGFGCYPTAYYCDGVNHCRNGYDETECSCDTTYQRGCPNSSVCLTNTSWCNGSEECPNGEDEAPESCCPSNLFGCYSSGSLQCLQLDLLCDGMQDCDNREDEDNENCTNPSHTSSTPMTSPPPSTGHPNTSIQLPIIITVSFIALLIVLVVICILCMAVLRCVHKRSAKFRPTRGAMIYKPSSSPSENGSLYYSETSGGTHLTHLDPYGNNLSPSSTDSTFKRVSVLSTDPSNPPPTPNTERRSAFVTTEIGIDGMSTLSQPFSECDSHVPPNPPAPSLNFDEMSSMSCSVSQRNVQVAMNGIDPHTHVHRHNRYGHGRNPLLAHNNHHYQQERYYHPSYYYHQHNPYSHHFANHRPPHLHHAHFVRAHGERFDAQSDSESTLSMTTVNTDNQDDLPPPGRPPSPATMTEYSETHIHPLPSTSPISEDSEECSENFLHQE